MCEALFGYNKRYNVTHMLLELFLPSLDTLVTTGRDAANRLSVASSNQVVQLVISLRLAILLLSVVCVVL